MMASTVSNPAFVPDFCYETVTGVMSLAVTYRYFSTAVPSSALRYAKGIWFNLLSSLRDKISGASWIKNPVRDMLSSKAATMGLLLAYPGEFSNDSLLEAFYGECRLSAKILGHETMHAFDIKGITVDAGLRPVNFKNTTTMREYNAKVLCLRASYEKEESKFRARTTDHKTDSEGFVDYAGLLLAHDAYRKLPDEERAAVLPGVGLNAEQTFFVAHCIKWCTPDKRNKRIPGAWYWHRRSRTTTTLKPDGRHLAAEFINASLNWNFAPCDDFYKFVCSRFAGNKTVLGYVEINSEDQDWLEAKHEKFSSADLTSHYTEYLRDYDSSIVVTKISESIISSERARQWVWLVSRFTSKNFTATDTVLVLDSAPSVVGLLMDRGRLARHDARVLLAWTLVHRLLPFAHSKWFLKNSAEYTSVEAFTSSVCYRTVSSVMSMAVYHRYFSTFVPPKVVESAESMVRSLMDTLEVKVSSTSWIKEPVRSVLLTKAREMALLMAYPDEYRNETAVVDFYGLLKHNAFVFLFCMDAARFPDVGAEFFTPYVASLRLLTMRIFRGHVNAVFKPAHVNALFNFEENIIKVYAGILQPPVFFYGAPAAINYGGLGQAQCLNDSYAALEGVQAE
ncbi:hypothetical protein V5799_009989 [Amblyomma americanum]|uniref:M13 family peptidase n=1 Tax=Amblyomma americanum TaxID=6943 RepID=A0AAQ4F8W3_AMBAM